MQQLRPPSDASLETATQDLAFAQCVQAMRRTLSTTPLGWLLIAWVGHDRIPAHLLELWIGSFAAVWVIGFLWLQWMARVGAKRAQHLKPVMGIAMLDGACWGAVVGVLMGASPMLDGWLGAVICGAAAINAPTYLTFFAAFRAQVLALWAVAMLGTVAHWNQPLAIDVMLGLTLFLLLIVGYMRSISDRVVDGIRLQLRNAELAEKLRNSLHVKEQEAATDVLTSLMNRRAFDDLLDGYARDQRGLAVLMLDIDHFKAVNDAHGHAVGDALLRGFAACIRGQLRGSDVCARYGGEEFVVVLPGASNDRAMEVAERLCHTVAAAPLIDEPALHITVSIGVGIRHPTECVRRLMARADAAVYAAKHGGRNQVCVAE